MQIIYWTGKENLNADALSHDSHQPYSPAPIEGVAECDMQVCTVTRETNIESSDDGH